jgi:peptidoglycan hydrolase-like protein with peptidoglycan-binding domain
MLQAVADNTPDDLLVSPTQGSYTTETSGSAGTHAGGGVVDIRIRNLNASQRKTLLTEMRRVGFAAWNRTASQGFNADHCHAVAVQPGGKDDKGVLSTSAHNQVIDYYEDRNGLANDHEDDGPRDFVGVTWESYKSGGSAPAFPGTITPGARGSIVRTWQDLMVSRRFMADTPGNHDGWYGPGMTEKARAAQRALHVPVDSVLGPVTWNAMVAHR